MHIDQSRFELRIKQLFLDLMIFLMHDFEDFYRPKAMYFVNNDRADKAEEAKWKKATAHQVFDFEKYTSQANNKEFRMRFVHS